MIDISRHHEYFPISSYKDKTITLIGVGATGSRIFEALINLGFSDIHLYDPDVVENHNIANQLYTAKDVGELKVHAASTWETCNTGEAACAKVYPEKIEGNCRHKVKGIVFLLTDTMLSRGEIANNTLKMNPNVELVIETRMAISHGNINMFNPMIMKEYLQWFATLISDDAGEESACGTSLTIGTTASIIANIAVNMMINYLIIEDKQCVDKRCDIMLNPLGIHVSNWENNNA